LQPASPRAPARSASRCPKADHRCSSSNRSELKHEQVQQHLAQVARNVKTPISPSTLSSEAGILSDAGRFKAAVRPLAHPANDKTSHRSPLRCLGVAIKVSVIVSQLCNLQEGREADLRRCKKTNGIRTQKRSFSASGTVGALIVQKGEEQSQQCPRANHGASARARGIPITGLSTARGSA